MRRARDRSRTAPARPPRGRDPRPSGRARAARARRTRWGSRARGGARTGRRRGRARARRGSPALDEGDDRCHRERPLDDLREGFADRHVFPVARRGAADRLPRVRTADPLDLLGRVAVGLERPVLLELARGVALGPEAPRVRLADDRPRVVHKRRAVGLPDRATRERRGLLLEVEQNAPPEHAVALADRAAPAEIGARVHRVAARAPRDVARHDPVHREEDRRRRRARRGPERVAGAAPAAPLARRATPSACALWPRSAAGAATTRASRTSGWLRSASSISTALIVQPAEMITSSERPSWWT